MLSEKIVVIDNDIRFIKKITEKLIEYEFIYFLCGEEALKFLKRSCSVRLVLLDFKLPGIDGLGVLKEIKKFSKGMKVILITAYGTLDIAIEAINQQVDAFIEKPIDIQGLKFKIEKVLNRGMTQRQLKMDSPVDRIKRFIERNPKGVSLQQIADEMCLTTTYISRLFCKHSECSFREYRMKIKIDFAKKLLEETILNIAELSFELGYENPESFMRIFKGATGITPTEYRNQLK